MIVHTRSDRAYLVKGIFMTNSCYSTFQLETGDLSKEDYAKFSNFSALPIERAKKRLKHWRLAIRTNSKENAFIKAKEYERKLRSLRQIIFDVEDCFFECLKKKDSTAFQKYSEDWHDLSDFLDSILNG